MFDLDVLVLSRRDCIIIIDKLPMNRIDVSAIQPHPSQQEDNFLSRSQHTLSNEHSRNISSQQESFTVQQSLKRHSIFRNKQQAGSGQVAAIRSKISFKVPPIEDYYIRQCRENIHPNKVHRMESLIQAPPRDQKTSVMLPQNSTVSSNQKSGKNNHLFLAVIMIIIAALVWFFSK